MKKQQYVELVKELREIIARFENENWIKMATSTDLAKYIVSRGFCPSDETKRYMRCLKKISTILDNYYDEEYDILEKKGVDKIKQAISDCVGINDEN